MSRVDEFVQPRNAGRVIFVVIIHAVQVVWILLPRRHYVNYQHIHLAI